MPRLQGMAQITDYVRRSEATVLSYIRQLDFPAVKLGCIWVSDTKKVDDWFSNQIENGKTPLQKKVTAKQKNKSKIK